MQVAVQDKQVLLQIFGKYVIWTNSQKRENDTNIYRYTEKMVSLVSAYICENGDKQRPFP
jgi:hypothetical protein